MLNNTNFSAACRKDKAMGDYQGKEVQLSPLGELGVHTPGEVKKLITNLQSTNTVHIEGDLTFRAIPAISKKCKTAIASNVATILDFSQVTASDNTSIGLLISLASYAKSINKKVSYVGLPLQLLTLVEVAEVERYLPILR